MKQYTKQLLKEIKELKNKIENTKEYRIKQELRWDLESKIYLLHT